MRLLVTDAGAIGSACARMPHDRRHPIDDAKTRGVLGCRPQRDFESGPAETVARNREHRSWSEPAQGTIA